LPLIARALMFNMARFSAFAPFIKTHVKNPWDLLSHTGSYSFLALLVAEREGFEPSVRLHVRLISSQVHSTTLPPFLSFISLHIDSAAKRVIIADSC
jgi:hypothetical protein